MADGRRAGGRHCFTYIGYPNGPIQRPKPVRYVQYECYETTARSETRKLARVRPARCPAWGRTGEYGLKSGENGQGRFAISINVICGNPFKPSEKAISRGDRLCRRPPPTPRQGRVLAGCFVDYDACANLGKHRVVCGFSWLLRVIDHEAVLMDPKLFSRWVHRSVVLLKRGFRRQTSSRWRFSRKNDSFGLSFGWCSHMHSQDAPVFTQHCSIKI
jgi:hypothetical protein